MQSIDSLAITSRGVVPHGGDGANVPTAVEADGSWSVKAERHGRHNPEAERVARAVERYVDSAGTRALPFAGGAALMGLILMSWPARRGREDDFLPPLDAAAPSPAVENA
jgi:hypothetical protein